MNYLKYLLFIIIISITIKSISAQTYPTLQASNIEYASVSDTSIYISWSSGDGYGRVIFLKETSDSLDNPLPTDSTIYASDSTFKVGDGINDSGWYCIYNSESSIKSSLTIYGLDAAEYKVKIIEYNLTDDFPIYLLDTIATNPIFINNFFTKKITNFQGVYQNQFGDFDNDNDIDIINHNYNGGVLLLNQGNYEFEADTFKTGLGYGRGTSAIALHDLNNDSYIDASISYSYHPNFYEEKTEVFLNDKSNSFTINDNYNFEGSCTGSANWFYFNRDSKPDFFIQGVWKTELYISDQDEYTDTLYIEDLIYSSSDVGDYNSDGYTDLIITGEGTSLNYELILYKNIIGKYFEKIDFNILTGNLDYSAEEVRFGDVDNDSDLDILYISNYECRLFINEGEDVFSEVQIDKNLSGNYSYLGDWIDFDNDGDLDIIFSTDRLHLYENLGSLNFRKTSFGNGIDFKDYRYRRLADLDNDGDIDILVGGSDNYAVAINNSHNLNTKPPVPTNLRSEVIEDTIIFRWDFPEITDNTNKSLTYNVAVFDGDGNNIVAPLSDLASGYRKVNQRGNAGNNNYFIISGFDFKSYKWSVQTVDNSYNASAFATYEEIISSNNSMEYYDKRIKVYPNPANEYVNISIEEEIYGKKTVQIFDISGKLVLSDSFMDNHYQITTNNFIKGIYFMKINSTEFSYVGKIIIE